MDKKWIILISVFIFMISLSAVSASDDINETLEISDDTQLGADAGTFSALQNRINSASSGSTINLENDYTYNSGFSTGGIIIKKSLTINGNGHTINALGKSAIIRVADFNTVTFNNINFINGYYDYESGALSARGIDAVINVNNCNFENNYGGWYGGAISAEVANINNCNFRNNHAYFNGGALFFEGGSINNCLFENSIVEKDDTGGAISIDVQHPITITQSRFINNHAFSGGAIHVMGGASMEYAPVVISNSYFEKNTAEDGGAITASGNDFDQDLFMEIKNCNFVENSNLDGRGSTIYGYKYLNIDGCDFTNNGAESAVIYYANSITNCNFNSDKDCCFVYDVENLKNNKMTANNKYDVELLDGASDVKFNLNMVFVNSLVAPDSNIKLCQLQDDDGNKIKLWTNPTVNAKFTNRDTGQTSSETLWSEDGRYYYTCNLAEGVYDVTASVDSGNVKVKPGVLTVDGNTDYTLTAQNLTKYVGGPEKLTVSVINGNGRLIPGLQVSFTINGKDYKRTTNSEGIASMNINLGAGNYSIRCSCADASCEADVQVISTLYGSDLTKYHRNASQYYITCLDGSGNKVAKGSVEFNINGVFYTRTVTDGVGKLNINLEPGDYIITARNLATNELHSNNVKVLTTIVDNHDLTKYYRNASHYVLKLLDGQGNAAGAGQNVSFNINGVFYTRTSNATGHVKLNINLQPGTYIITAVYNGLAVANTVKVLPILQAEDLSMSYRDGSKFNVTVLDGQGNPNPLENITFNINGVFYNRTCDSEGVAHLNINLIPGEYIITSMYNNIAIANKITISS
ncbi:hypothetical protein [Methanobrevibacter sp.]|uniref:hypothetical protein n=1 Tax=Methanobrevibacter sp. TaxID=66852 RepID=UPI0038903069